MAQRKRLGNSFSALLILALCACAASWGADKSTAAKADRVLIVKSTRTLTLLNHGQVLKTYQVALGGDPVGPKVKAGDTNPADRERARKLGVNPGGGVEIHGLEAKYAWVGSLHRQVNWTAGWVAVTNPEIEEIYKLVPVGTPVEIRADEKPVEHTESVDPKTGNLHLTIPIVASKPKQ
jgi:murein L,D-transpeptidase YafK